MKVAIITEWLKSYAGSERVLEQMLLAFPAADLFAVVDFLPANERGFLGGKTPKVSFIQGLPFARSHFRHYLPLMPLAVEQFDLSSYDLILSSSHAVAKGVIVGPDQLHISYVHSPMRYAWDLQHQYLRESGLDRTGRGLLIRCLLHYLRLWDTRTALGVDHFITNSHFIGRRVKRVYGRESEVIYPPVDIEAFPLQVEKASHYVTASRMVPYKRLDVIVEAFNAMPEKRLIVIGDGPDFKKIKAMAGPNIELLGYQTKESLRDHLKSARAFVFAAEEDFGILPVEAMASGTPVIAFGKGGALETVIEPGGTEPPTGLFFDKQSREALIEAVHRFESQLEVFEPEAIRRHTEKFSIPRFQKEWTTFISSALSDWKTRRTPEILEKPVADRAIAIDKEKRPKGRTTK